MDNTISVHRGNRISRSASIPSGCTILLLSTARTLYALPLIELALRDDDDEGHPLYSRAEASSRRDGATTMPLSQRVTARVSRP